MFRCTEIIWSLNFQRSCHHLLFCHFIFLTFWKSLCSNYLVQFIFSTYIFKTLTVRFYWYRLTKRKLKNCLLSYKIHLLLFYHTTKVIRPILTVYCIFPESSDCLFLFQVCMKSQKGADDQVIVWNICTYVLVKIRILVKKAFKVDLRN